MRFLPAFPALSLAIAGSLVAGDLPTVKLALPDVTTAVDTAPAAIDLRNHFEITSIVGPVVQFRTSMGSYNVELFPAAAPASVANFQAYVSAGHYASCFIHRSDQGLGVIQGGGYVVTSANPLSIARIASFPPIALEYNLPNVRGTIAMARTSALNSATSEWFINTVNNSTVLGASNNGGYAVFGRVTGTGMSVVDAIQVLPAYIFASPFGQLPLTGYVGGNVALANLVLIHSAEAIPLFPAAAGQRAVVQFSVANSNPGLATPTISGSVLSFALASGDAGTANLTVSATDTNGNAAQDIFRLDVSGPEIAVENPPGANVADGGSRAFPSVLVGDAAEMTFTIKNIGTSALTLTGIPKVTVDGANAGMFAVVSEPAVATIPESQSTIFRVRFAPTSFGIKAATLHVASDDGNEGIFDINITGQALTVLENWRLTHFGSFENTGVSENSYDYDGDGVANLLEFAFGLDPALGASRDLPRWERVGGNLVLTFAQPSDVSGIVYGAEWSANAAAGSWTTIPDSGTGRQHIFSIPISAVTKILVRLRATAF